MKFIKAGFLIKNLLQIYSYPQIAFDSKKNKN
jgi:hypothetical protein